MFARICSCENMSLKAITWNLYPVISLQFNVYHKVIELSTSVVCSMILLQSCNFLFLQTYSYMSDGPTIPTCVDDTALTVTLSLESSYVYDKTDPGYGFTVTVFNRCGEKGTVSNIDFNEAVDSISGITFVSLCTYLCLEQK